MSDKQREKHLAMYWNGPVSRVEAQKVFDETAKVIKHHQEIITKLDMVISFLVEKSGFATEEIQAWMNAKVQAHQEAQAALSGAQHQGEQTASPNEAPEGALIVA